MWYSKGEKENKRTAEDSKGEIKEDRRKQISLRLRKIDDGKEGRK